MLMSTSPMPETNLLAQPLRLPNGSVLRNRLAKSSMSETLATYDNHATEKLIGLYGRWAASGAGLLLTGNVMIDRRALGEPGNVVIEDEADLPILRQWARAATGQGAALWVQLNHPGKQSPGPAGGSSARCACWWSCSYASASVVPHLAERPVVACPPA